MIFMLIWVKLSPAKKKGRSNDTDITLFKSLGFALEDLVTAQAAYRKAKLKKIGLEFKFD